MKLTIKEAIELRDWIDNEIESLGYDPKVMTIESVRQLIVDEIEKLNGYLKNLDIMCNKQLNS